MISSLIGMTVARAIPNDALLGLATGQYTLHGGVIRWAAGTPLAGQIVCHLIPTSAASLAPFAALGILPRAAALGPAIPLAAAAMPLGIGVAAASGVAATVVGGISMVNTFKILKVVKRIESLAEMNLAVSRAGFASLERRLDQLESKIDQLKASVTAVLTLLHMEQRAELRVALDHLNRIDLIGDPDVRRELLVASAATLGKIGLIYEQRLAEAAAPTEAMISEEYYCIAMLAQARCYAELRELAMARRILETTHERWLKLARHVITHFLLGPNPEKFLASEFAADVSIIELAEWLDFANDTAKGLAWIDELRARGDAWYYYKELNVQPASRRMARQTQQSEIVEIHRDRHIPALQKLVARHSVFETYVAQYALMEQHKLTAIEFERLLGTVGPEEQVDGFLILEPAAGAPA